MKIKVFHEIACVNSACDGSMLVMLLPNTKKSLYNVIAVCDTCFQTFLPDDVTKNLETQAAS